MKRRTLLGPYEMVNEHWTSSRVEEGTVRQIEGRLYHAVDDVLKGVYDIKTGYDNTKVSKWVPVDSQE